MIIVLKPHCSDKAIDQVVKHIKDLGYDPRVIKGDVQTVIGAVGDENMHTSLDALKSWDSVEKVVPVQKKHKLCSREFHPEDQIVDIGKFKIGGGHFQTIAGPCGIESREQIFQATRDLVECGVNVIRGGAFKPRTSPYDFQGLGQEGLDLLKAIKDEFDVAVVTELVGVDHIPAVAKVADMIQIGARNCQNYNLLEKVAGAGRPVLLKRGMATSISEWFSAAEYLKVHGCSQVVLCERGIRTFETALRNTLDVGAIAVAKKETYLPIIVDPSHAAGRLDMVLPLAKAGVAAGADGIIVEAHPNPHLACSDAAQQIPSAEFNESFMKKIRPYIELEGKTK